MRVLACLDPVPAEDGSCAQQAWVEQTGALPMLSLQDAERIGDAMLLALVPIVAIKLFLNPFRNRRTP